MSLPAKGPRPHGYFETPGARVDVGFDDAEGHARRVSAHYKVAGSGPPLVLVHGLMTSSYSWRHVIDALAKHYRVIVPDLVGSGDSDKPGDLVYSIANVARFLAAFIRATCDESPYLVGNSLGGLYTLRALLDHACARRYVLIHAPGFPMLRSRLLNLLLGIPGMTSFGAGVIRRGRRHLVRNGVHYHREDQLSLEEVLEYGRPLGEPAGARAFVRILRESLDPREHARLIADVRGRGAVGCPTLLLYAREDVMVPPAFGPRFAELLPGVELRVLDDTSHFVQVDAPEATVREILTFDGR